MTVFCVADLEHERAMVFFRKALERVLFFFRERVVDFPEVTRKLSASLRLRRKYYLAINNGHDAEESVLLPVDGKREGESLLEHLWVCFWTFVEVEELVVGAEHDVAAICINEQPACLDRPLVPALPVKRLIREVEREQIVVALRLDADIGIGDDRVRRLVLRDDFLLIGDKNFHLFLGIIDVRIEHRIRDAVELPLTSIPKDDRF